MLHVRQGRWQRIPGVRRAHTPGGRPAVGARHTRPEAVLLPPDDPVARRADRRGSSVRLIGPSLHGRVFTAAVLRVAPRVRGVAWFGRGDLASSGPQEILPAWGAGDSGSNPDGPNQLEQATSLLHSRGLPCLARPIPAPPRDARGRIYPQRMWTLGVRGRTPTLQHRWGPLPSHGLPGSYAAPGAAVTAGRCGRRQDDERHDGGYRHGLPRHDRHIHATGARRESGRGEFIEFPGSGE